VSGIDTRLAALEHAYASALNKVPGTQLVRQLDPEKDGTRWCLGLGPLLEPGKVFFYGDTIEEVLSQAEKATNVPKPYLWQCPECEKDGLECSSDCGHALQGKDGVWELVPCKEAVCPDCGRVGPLGPEKTPA